MKKIVLFVSFFNLIFIAQAQEKYWVYFTDKPTISNEIIKENFTQEGIERREFFNIPFDVKDIPVNKNYLQKLKSIGGVEQKGTSKWFNAAIFTVEDSEKLNQIESFEFVKRVEKVSSLKSLKSTGNEKLKADFSQNQISNIAQEFYGEAYDQTNLINLIPLHSEGFLGNGIKIGVFDAGFFGADTLNCFKKLRDDNRILGTYDLVDSDNAVYDKHTHGTYVLSCISAFQENLLVGTAPEASVYLFRTENGASETLIEEYNWVKAAEMADSLGIHIINSSLGYTFFDDSNDNHTYDDMDGNTTIITRGADIAASKGILVVNSAGNSGTQGWRYIGAPADGDSVFSIGAINTDGEVADFSSYGPTVDGRIKPNICGVGWGTAVCSFDNKVAFLNGTSFSSPLTAGAMASLWSKFPLANNIELMRYVEKSADRYLNPDDRCGYGIPDFGEASTALSSVYPSFESGQLTVYPNPSEGELNFGFVADTQVTGSLEMFDLMGRLVYSATVNANQGTNYLKIENLGLNAGLYQVRLNTGKKSYQKKVLIQKNNLTE